MNNADMPAIDFEYGEGLTKREHFAGLALQGLLSNDVMMQFSLGVADKRSSNPFGLVADQAVSFADALLKELEK